ncbi:MAG: SPOR domain-containing protein [Sphingobacteriales bacterium]|nr:SPOR domain-containing protein [Sphingobacteriales bacterium]
MDISSYIAEYIRENQILIVPGLGTFTKEQVPARFDTANDRFLPPTERIVFSSSFSDDLGLQKFICTAEKAKPKAVAQFIEQYVSNLIDLLATTEEIKIDALGTFKRTSTKLTFKADESLASNVSYFGLKPQKEKLGIQAPVEEVSLIPEEAAITEIPTEEPILESQEEEPILESQEEEELEEVQGSSKLKKAVLILFILALSALAGLQIYCPSLLGHLWNVPVVASKPVIDTITTKIDTTLKADSTLKSDSTNLKTDSLAPLASAIPLTSPSFEIIIAAFYKQSEADEFIKQLATRQINAHSIQTKKGGLFKISVGTFSDQATASTELLKLNKDLAKNAWIYRVKPLKTTENVSTTN